MFFYVRPNVQPLVKIARLWHESDGPLPCKKRKAALRSLNSKQTSLASWRAKGVMPVMALQAEGAGTSSGVTSSGVSTGSASSSGPSAKTSAVFLTRVLQHLRDVPLAMVDYHPISARDQSRLRQFGKKVLPRIFLGHALCAGMVAEHSGPGKLKTRRKSVLEG